MTRILQIALSISWLLAALGIFLVAGLRFGEPIWIRESQLIAVAASFAYIFLLSLTVYGIGTLVKAEPKRLGILTAFLACILVATAIVYSFSADTDMSRFVLGYQTILLFTLLLINTHRRVPTIAKICINTGLLIIAIPPSLTDTSRMYFKEFVLGNRSTTFDDSAQYVISGRYDLKITNLPILNRPAGSRTNGGAIVRLADDRYIVSTAHGDFFEVLLAGEDVITNETGIRTPLNLERNTEGFPTGHFRVTDIFLVPGDGSEGRLLASHSFWNVDRGCVTLRLSETIIDITNLGKSPPDWQIRFETSPCLDVDWVDDRSGGRIALLSEDTVLMTVGSQAYEQSVADLSDFDKSSYGKIFRFDLDDWSYEVYSTGHRNPQGLLVTEDAIWSTEHGPQGGDELNLIFEGEDYGWPRSTFGTEYGQKFWPMLTGPEDHSIGRPPVYAWMPSIGASQLIQVSGRAFPEWENDLLVSSLKGNGGFSGHSLYRVRMRDGRAILIERIQTGRQIRDLVERDDGVIVLWDGYDTLQVVEPAAHVFAACSGCHAIGDGAFNGIGPDLLNILDRKRVADNQGFEFSEAMKAFGGRWTTERLNAFLRDPDGVVPGTTMEFPGIEDDELRSEIIEYLVESIR